MTDQENKGEVGFETLVRPYIGHMYQLAYRLTGSGADAEDLVQDVLVKIYPRRHELPQLEKLRPWLAKVLYRLFIDQQRRAARSPLRLLRFIKKDDKGDDTLRDIASDAPGPAEILDRRFSYGEIRKALNDLNQDQRHLCILHDMEGYTLRELEEILSVPVGTLKSRLHRARAILRKKLKLGTF